MSAHTLVWQRPAMSGFARIRANDPPLAKAVRAAVSGLADDVTPAGSSPLGATGLFRLRVGDARIVYHVDAAAKAVQVLSLGRIGA